MSTFPAQPIIAHMEHYTTSRAVVNKKVLKPKFLRPCLDRSQGSCPGAGTDLHPRQFPVLLMGARVFQAVTLDLSW